MSIGDIPSNLGEGFGTMDPAALAAGQNSSYNPGDLEFAFVVDPNSLILYATGGQPYAVTVSAVHNADSAILDPATIASALVVKLAFAPFLGSTGLSWIAAPVLYGATFGAEIVGAAAGANALAVGTYYASVQVANTSGTILWAATLGIVSIR